MGIGFGFRRLVLGVLVVSGTEKVTNERDQGTRNAIMAVSGITVQVNPVDKVDARSLQENEQSPEVFLIVELVARMCAPRPGVSMWMSPRGDR